MRPQAWLDLSACSLMLFCSANCSSDWRADLLLSSIIEVHRANLWGSEACNACHRLTKLGFAGFRLMRCRQWHTSARQWPTPRGTKDFLLLKIRLAHISQKDHTVLSILDLYFKSRCSAIKRRRRGVLDPKAEERIEEEEEEEGKGGGAGGLKNKAGERRSVTWVLVIASANAMYGSIGSRALTSISSSVHSSSESGNSSRPCKHWRQHHS